MTKQGLRTASIIIGCVFILGRAAAEPTSTGQPASEAAMRVPVETQDNAECTTATGDVAAGCGSLFGTMMEYQRAVGKERREDRQVRASDRQRETAAKAAKIKADNAAIDTGMQESREKAEALEQPGGQGTVVVQPPPGVLGAKPPAGTGTTIELCKTPPCG